MIERISKSLALADEEDSLSTNGFALSVTSLVTQIREATHRFAQFRRASGEAKSFSTLMDTLFYRSVLSDIQRTPSSVVDSAEPLLDYLIGVCELAPLINYQFTPDILLVVSGLMGNGCGGG